MSQKDIPACFTAANVESCLDHERLVDQVWGPKPPLPRPKSSKKAPHKKPKQISLKQAVKNMGKPEYGSGRKTSESVVPPPERFQELQPRRAYPISLQLVKVRSEGPSPVMTATPIVKVKVQDHTKSLLSNLLHNPFVNHRVKLKSAMGFCHLRDTLRYAIQAGFMEEEVMVALLPPNPEQAEKLGKPYELYPKRDLIPLFRQIMFGVAIRMDPRRCCLKAKNCCLDED